QQDDINPVQLAQIEGTAHMGPGAAILKQRSEVFHFLRHSADDADAFHRDSDSGVITRLKTAKGRVHQAKTWVHSSRLARKPRAICLAPSRLWLAAQPHWTSLHAGTSVASSTSSRVFCSSSRTAS